MVASNRSYSQDHPEFSSCRESTILISKRTSIDTYQDQMRRALDAYMEQFDAGADPFDRVIDSLYEDL